MEQNIIHWKEKINATLRLMFNLDPQHVLARGYSIARIAGKILKTTTGLNINDDIETQLGDGMFISKVINIKKSEIRSTKSEINPKSEARNPKQIKNPKSEIQNTLGL